MSRYIDIKSEFEDTSSLRDIYIFNTDEKIWNKVINEINKSSYISEFWHGDNKTALPTTFSEIKELQESDPTILKIFLNNVVQVNCYFFVEDEIEMDITPKEITDEAKYNNLVSFLSWLSGVTNSSVSLTHEDSQEQVILSVSQ